MQTCILGKFTVASSSSVRLTPSLHSKYSNLASSSDPVSRPREFEEHSGLRSTNYRPKRFTGIECRVPYARILYAAFNVSWQIQSPICLNCTVEDLTILLLYY